MSGGFRGSNGPQTTDGTGAAGVIGRVRKEQRNRRPTSSRRTVALATTAAVTAGNFGTWDVTFAEGPYEDTNYVPTAQVVNSAGYPYGFASVANLTPSGCTVLFRAYNDTPAGAIVQVRAIHP